MASKSFDKFVTRNKIGQSASKPKRKKKTEDSPGWRASKDGNKTGWERGVWYEKGKRTSRFGPH